MVNKIGIIAGSGQFPFLIARNARAAGKEVNVCGIRGNTDPALEAEADHFTMVNLGQLGALIDFFKKRGVTRVCMAGAISKPKALDVKPDMRAARMLFKLMGNKGDDAILRAVAEELHSDGIEVVQPDSLVPALPCPPGILTECEPSAEVWADIRFGWHIAKTLGGMDIGQCVVVRSGIVIAVEAIEGTDAVLTRGGELGGPGCTVVKVAKPGQDERIDLPSVGSATIGLLERYQYACLALEAGKTLFFDRETACAQAQRAGIAVVSVPAENAAFLAEKK